MRRRIALLLLALCLLSGCAPLEEPAEEPPLFPAEETPDAADPAESTLPAEFSLPYLAGQPLNPLTCPDGMQQTVASLLYEGLFQLDPAMEPQPLLCSGYEYHPDTLTYTLTLRVDAVFSDGSPLTAADVRASLTAAKSSPRYGERLSDLRSVTAGNGTVTLTLTRPNAALPALLDIPILKSGTERSSVPTGTGPYVYDESAASRSLIASQNWWQGKPQPVERIPLTEAADAAAMTYRFTSREVQAIVLDLTGTDSAAVSGSVRYADADTTVMQYLGINTASPALSRADLRRALSLGLQRRTLVSALLSGHGKAAQFPISPASPLYPAELERTDSSTAFSQALTACGALPERTLRLLVNAENSFKVSVAQQIADTFTAAGVPVEAVVLPWEEYTAALESGSFDLYYGEVRLRADWDLSALLSAGGSLNYGGWNDPQCESLLVECRTASDRAGALSRLCLYLQQQAPILPICFKTVSVLYEADVLDGLTPTAAEPFYRFSDCTVHLKPAA